MKSRPFFLSACVILFTASAASAALIQVQGTFRVTEGVRPELAGQVLPGDTFGFSFFYDDSITETNSTGLFNSAVVSGGTFEKLSGPGLWSPGPGNLGPGTVGTQNDTDGLFGTAGVSDGLSFYPFASGFANAGDYSFRQLYIPLRRTDLSTVVAGQTLGQHLSGRAANSLTWISGPASLDFVPNQTPFLFQAAPGVVTMVPEPVASLMVLSSLAMALRRGR